MRAPYLRYYLVLPPQKTTAREAAGCYVFMFLEKEHKEFRCYQG